MTRYSAVLFDLDGTLLNTLPDLCDATNAMRMELGLSPLASDIVASYLGDGVDCLIKRALNQQLGQTPDAGKIQTGDRKSTRLNSSHVAISYISTLSLHDALPIFIRPRRHLT